MPVVTPISIARIPSAALSTERARKQWERDAARITRDAADIGPKVSAARRGGSGISADAGAIRINTAQAARGVSDARPNREQRAAANATSNIPGVSANIRDAQRNAFDPRADPARPDMGAPERAVGPNARQIGRGGQHVERQGPKADELEHRI